MESKNSLIWKGHCDNHPVQPSGNELAHLQIDPVAQSPIPLDLEYFQGWDIHHLSEQPVPVFHYPHNKKGLSYI